MKTHRLAGTCYDYGSEWYLATVRTEYPDITAGFYDGDYGKSLERAQRDKHRWVLKGIGFRPGDRVLDIGCGWGAMLNAIREAGGSGIGFCISRKQVDYCAERGLLARFQDWKDADPDSLPAFDAIVSIGAFEHFCSPEEYRRGEQERIYERFFEFCHRGLKQGGRMFLQTMTWGSEVPDNAEIAPNAPEDSRYRDRVRGQILGMTSWWPPASEEQIVASAWRYFEPVESRNGRLDYGQTLFEWHRCWNAVPAWKKTLILLSEYARNFPDPDFRRSYPYVLSVVRKGYFREAFLQDILSHSRVFFKKRTA